MRIPELLLLIRRCTGARLVAAMIGAGVVCGGLARPTPAWAEEARTGTLAVTVDPGSSGLDPAAVRAAITAELGVEVVDSPTPGVAGTMQVTIQGQTTLSMSFASTDGWVEVKRSLELPRDPDLAVEAIALLSGNLARNQAGELLAGLKKTEPPPREPAAPPPPAKPAAARSSAPPPPPPPVKTPSACALARAGLGEMHALDLSLLYPVATSRNSHRKSYYAELGLLSSRVGGLNGGGLNLLHLRIDGPTVGATLGGLLTEARGPVCGATLGGLATLGNGPMDGFDFALGLAARSGKVRGWQVGGLFASSEGFEGLQMTVGVARARGAFVGVQASSLLGLVEGDLQGQSLTFGASVVTGKAGAMQLSGLANYAGGKVEGAQVSGAYNHSADLDGLQLGLFNQTRRVRGVQIGVVNLSQRVDGVAIGLVNWVTDGRTQLVSWVDGPARGNVGAKYLFGPAYTLVGVGVDVEPATAASYALGLHLPWRRWFADVDLLYSFVGDHYLQGAQRFHARHEFRTRGMVGVEIVPRKFGLFAGGAAEYGIDSDRVDLGWRPEAVAGVQVF